MHQSRREAPAPRGGECVAHVRASPVHHDRPPEEAHEQVGPAEALHLPADEIDEVCADDPRRGRGPTARCETRRWQVAALPIPRPPFLTLPAGAPAFRMFCRWPRGPFGTREEET